MFDDLLIQTQRKTGSRKKTSIIAPHLFKEFFTRLKSEPIDNEIKTILAIAISGGMRITEALSIRRCDIDLADGFVKVKVLKKRGFYKAKDGRTKPASPVYRDALLIDEALEISRDYLTKCGARNYEKIFGVTRSTIHRHIKKIFGADASAHSISRHSFISHLFFEKEQSNDEIQNIMELSRRYVDTYNHMDVKRHLKKIKGK